MGMIEALRKKLGVAGPAAGTRRVEKAKVMPERVNDDGRPKKKKKKPPKSTKKVLSETDKMPEETRRYMKEKGIKY
jgi:hypothetical protein